MNKLYYLWVISLLLSNCRTLEEKTFFEVSLDPPQAISVDSIRLTGHITGAGDLNVTSWGFVYSDDSDVQPSALSGINRIVVPITANASFSTPIAIKPGELLYCWAFLQSGERTVYSPELRAIQSGINLSIAGTPFVYNDSAAVYGQLLGLNSIGGAHVMAYGHVYSKTETIPVIGGPNCDSTLLGASQNDRVFTSQLPHLDFNSTYHYRAYFITDEGSPPYYSEVKMFEMKGGWKQMAPAPVPLYSATGIGIGDWGFLGFGSHSEALVLSTDYLRSCWRFWPSETGGHWEDMPDYTAPGDNPHVNATSFQIGDTLYVLNGSYNEFTPVYSRDFHKYNIPLGSWSYSAIPSSLAGRRTGAVSFALNGKGYVGTGENNGGVRNDFWEYTPETGIWRSLADLPQKLSPTSSLTIGGRTEASVFLVNGVAYVGGGITGNDIYTDFWKFIPPVSPLDTGKWELATFFPGAPRYRAIAFTVNSKAYYGLGADGINYATNYQDVWEYDPAVNQWKQQNDFPGGKRYDAIGFSLNQAGYVGTGIGRILLPNEITIEKIFNDFWQFVPNH